MKEIIVESVDDGCEGFYRTEINGQKLVADDMNYFFEDVLRALGYNVVYNNIEELE